MKFICKVISQDVKFNVKLFIYLFELFPNPGTLAPCRTFDAIVKVAVIEHQLRVVNKLLHAVVVVIVESLFNQTEVHRILDYLCVVRNLLRLGVYRLQKYFSLWYSAHC